MNATQAIRTEEEIDAIVASITGTWVKRRNARKKLAGWSNELVNEEIMICKGKIRDLRAMGNSEQALRHWYAEVTKLELKILW
jgi:hypothetical protein